jgi:hypothetical protein
MSWQAAPVYVRAHDLARWMHEHGGLWREPAAAGVAAALTAGARDLVRALALALTFPGERAAQQQQADEAVVTLRVLLRLARDLGLLSASAHRYAAGEVDAIGRMLGGWRRHTPRRRAGRGTGETTGDGPQAGPIA